MRVGWPLLPHNRNLTKDVLFGSFPPFLSLNILGIQHSYQLAKCANWGSMNHSLYFKVASIMNREAGTSLFSSLNKWFYKAGTWGSQMRWQGWAPAFNAFLSKHCWHRLTSIPTFHIYHLVQPLVTCAMKTANSFQWLRLHRFDTECTEKCLCVSNIQYTRFCHTIYYYCHWLPADERLFISWGALCTHHLTFWRVFSLAAWWYVQLNGRNS